MNRSLMCLCVAIAVLWSAEAYGHHSAAAAYKVLETVTIEGELDEVVLRAPHSWMYVVTRDENGNTTRWRIEWPSGQAARQAAANFKVGDKVAITGNPARNPRDERMLIVTITRPSDGFTWGTPAEGGR